MLLKYGFEQAKSMQDLQIMTHIVSNAFGSGTSDTPVTSNHQEAQAQLNSIFGKGL